MNGVPDLPADCWLMQAFNYVRIRSKLPDPILFWLTTAYCGAALHDYIWVNWATKPIFPNLPLLIVAPTARGKTGGKNAIEPLFDRVLPPRLAEGVTAEAANRDLSLTRLSYNGNTVSLWVVPEMADVFGRKDYQQGLVAKLTRLLDNPTDMETSRITQARRHIQGRCVLHFIAGTTFDWLQLHVEDAITAGGFLPRLFCIYSNEPHKFIPNPQRDEKQESELNFQLTSLIRELERNRDPILLPAEEWLPLSRQVYEEQIEAMNTSLEPFIGRREENILRLWLIFRAFVGGEFRQISTSYVEMVKWFENQAVNLSDDLKFRHFDTPQRILGCVERYYQKHSQGITFAGITRLIRGLRANELKFWLHDLEAKGLIVWNPKQHGETGVISPVKND